MKRIWVMASVLAVIGIGIVLSMWVHIAVMTPAHSQTKPGAPAAGALPPPTDMPIPPELLGNGGGGVQVQPPQPQGQQAPAQYGGSTPSAPMGTPAGLTELPVPGQSELPQHPTPQQLDPSIKFTSGEGFFYDPTGRRDPFRPFVVKPIDMPPVEVKLTEEKPPPPPAPLPFAVTIPPGESIVSHDLSALKLVGILWDVKEPKAMIRSPAGKVYMLRRNSKIGRSNGYVAAIREGEIVVVELSQDGKTPSTKVISLQK
ncbi:MAG: hypothetical protein BroJett040_18010 [Oligoflexia bacterium]|nr:MAG: hypothetical protein BroJett040_18010 [Oligoflexia bacterium]